MSKTNRLILIVLSVFILASLIVVPLSLRCSSDTDDGWQVSTPEAENMNSRLLGKLVGKIHQGEYGNIHSLLVIKNGKIVLEEYASNLNKNTLHTLQSVSKSVISLLFGIAMDQGKIKSVDEELYRFFPEYKGIFDKEPEKKSLKLRDIITMTAGFKWEQLGLYVFDSNNYVLKMYNSSDEIKFVLSQPLLDRPGEVFTYSEGCSLLISSILSKSTGVDTEKYALEYLFAPLGIKKYQWAMYDAEKNSANVGGSLFLTPRDLGKIGQLFLNKGKWNGKQVVSEKWLKKSIYPYCKTGISNTQYGYFWWLYPIQKDSKIGSTSDYIYAATGYKGQYLFIVPSKNIVVVSTADNDGVDVNHALDFLYDYILKES